MSPALLVRPQRTSCDLRRAVVLWGTPSEPLRQLLLRHPAIGASRVLDVGARLGVERLLRAERTSLVVACDPACDTRGLTGAVLVLAPKEPGPRVVAGLPETFARRPLRCASALETATALSLAPLAQAGRLERRVLLRVDVTPEHFAPAHLRTLARLVATFDRCPHAPTLKVEQRIDTRQRGLRLRVRFHRALDPQRLRALLRVFYAEAPFVQVSPPVARRSPARDARQVRLAVDARSLTCALDAGALGRAARAIQILNRTLELPETLGLPTLRRADRPPAPQRPDL